MAWNLPEMAQKVSGHLRNRPLNSKGKDQKRRSKSLDSDSRNWTKQRNEIKHQEEFKVNTGQKYTAGYNTKLPKFNVMYITIFESSYHWQGINFCQLVFSENSLLKNLA